MRSEEFLDKYKQLEEALNLKYGFDEKTFGSPVVKFINDREGKNYREKLDLCREIRNFLSHHADIDGEAVIEPSESIIKFLDEVIQFVERPIYRRIQYQYSIQLCVEIRHYGRFDDRGFCGISAA